MKTSLNHYQFCVCVQLISLQPNLCVDVVLPKSIPSIKLSYTDSNTVTYSITRHTTSVCVCVGGGYFAMQGDKPCFMKQSSVCRFTLHTELQDLRHTWQALCAAASFVCRDSCTLQTELQDLLHILQALCAEIVACCKLSCKVCFTLCKLCVQR